MIGSNAIMALSSYFSPFFSYSHKSDNEDGVIPFYKLFKPEIKHNWKPDNKEGQL